MLQTIAFYNLENLFDTTDDPHTLDDDFTPKGKKRWTNRRYEKKLYKLATTISKIGVKSAGGPPVLLGISEVENAEVVSDLISSEPLKEYNYKFVHYDSPDERGIDTGLIYCSKHFELLFSEPIHLAVKNPNGAIDTTRDILYVYGKLNGEEVHVFVNHWPSRRDGGEETAYKRIKAANTIKMYMNTLEEEHKNPNYIVMGDFNDDPTSESIKTLLENSSLYNPMEKLLSPDRGSASYRKSWNLFDQILISHNFLNYEKGTHSFDVADIYDEEYLTEFKGKYKGNPYRTYVGGRYLGGFSDHFPVYLQLKLNS